MWKSGRSARRPGPAGRWLRAGARALAGAVALGVALPVGGAGADPAPGTLQGIVAAGNDHSCAVTTSGDARCWGANWAGQLGDGSRTDSNLPVAVSGLTRVARLALGEAHSCALGQGGGVFCWGTNDRGQLGTGDTEPRLRPARVPGIEGVALELAAGQNHSCARTSLGSVWCWGDNRRGQLATGLGTEFSTVPLVVQTLPQASARLFLGRDHSCSIGARHMLSCWGANTAGQLGDGTTTTRIVPVAVHVGRATVGAGGGRHSCVTLARGGVRCWGGNAEGQLGDGSTQGSLVPVTVDGVRSGQGAALAAGRLHSCALGQTGRLWCWGSNARGQLGSRAGAFSALPVPVRRLGTAPVLAVAAGQSHSCALSADSRIRCWGDNMAGQLGFGRTGRFRALPVLVPGADFGPPAP